MPSLTRPAVAFRMTRIDGLTHFSQRYDREDSQRLAGQAETSFGGQVVLARDLDRIPVPARHSTPEASALPR